MNALKYICMYGDLERFISLPEYENATQMIEEQEKNEKELHLRLWIEDLFGKMINSSDENENEKINDFNLTNINTNLTDIVQSYERVPIYKDKQNDKELITQLDFLQSQGTKLKSKLNGLENNDDTIYLRKITNENNNNNNNNNKSKVVETSDNRKTDKVVDNEKEFPEYAGDITESMGTIIESSDVHKVINLALLTNKFPFPPTQNQSHELNTSSWVNDNLPSVATAQIEVNTLRPTGATLPTLTRVRTDTHLLQGNNIYKHSFQTADQVNIFNSTRNVGLSQNVTDTSTTTTATRATTPKNFILIEKTLTLTTTTPDTKDLLKMSNNNLNVTNVYQQIDDVKFETISKPGNYMQVDPGNNNNSVADLKEILKIQPHIPQNILNPNSMHYDIYKEIESEFVKWNSRPAGRILHSDIGISINCVIYPIQKVSETHRDIVDDGVNVQCGNENKMQSFDEWKPNTATDDAHNDKENFETTTTNFSSQV